MVSHQEADELYFFEKMTNVVFLVYQTVRAVLSKQEELYDVLEQMKDYNWMVRIISIFRGYQALRFCIVGSA